MKRNSLLTHAGNIKFFILVIVIILLTAGIVILKTKKTENTKSDSAFIPAEAKVFGEELLVDEDFESDDVTNTWPEDFDVTIVRDDNPHSGKYCLKFVQVTDKNKIAYRQLNSPVTAGKKYQLSLWHKSRKGDTARFSIYDQTNQKHLLVEHKTESKWTKYKETIVIPAGCKKVNILLLAFGSGNTAWYDDVSFKEVK